MCLCIYMYINSTIAVAISNYSVWSKSKSLFYNGNSTTSNRKKTLTIYFFSNFSFFFFFLSLSMLLLDSCYFIYVFYMLFPPQELYGYVITVTVNPTSYVYSICSVYVYFYIQCKLNGACFCLLLCSNRAITAVTFFCLHLFFCTSATPVSHLPFK